jgi:hypothetical protein
MVQLRRCGPDVIDWILQCWDHSPDTLAPGQSLWTVPRYDEHGIIIIVASSDDPDMSDGGVSLGRYKSDESGRRERRDKGKNRVDDDDDDDDDHRRETSRPDKGKNRATGRGAAVTAHEEGRDVRPIPPRWQNFREEIQEDGQRVIAEAKDRPVPPKPTLKETYTDPLTGKKAVTVHPGTQANEAQVQKVDETLSKLSIE